MENKKRLIDANALPLGKFPNPRTEWHQGWNDALDAAKDAAETVDAVEVVRCKDCKWWSRNVGIVDSPNGHCFSHDIDPNGYDFCSYGERREGE